MITAIHCPVFPAQRLKTVIVLGMHRSATSMVARALHTCKEVDMGDYLLGSMSSNPKGHFEDRLFLSLNSDILHAAGGDWDDPPSCEKIAQQADQFSKRIKTAIRGSMKRAEEKGYPAWGWKDPRTILTIDLYMPYLDNPQFIITLRNPHDIAKSLQERDGFSIERGLNLAKEYQYRLTEFARKLSYSGT